MENQIKAFYCISEDGKIAVIEMAASSGLDKVAAKDRNSLVTTTYGFGELIRDALDKVVVKFLLEIGGSATNDGGAEMIMSLGGKLLDKDGKPISPNRAG